MRNSQRGLRLRALVQRAGLCALMVIGCDNRGGAAKVDTEETLRGLELKRRQAYSSEAKSTAAMISSSAHELNLCASTGAREGKVGPTPPMSVNCNASDTGKCVPVENPAQPWEYNLALWSDDVWTAIGSTGYRGEGHRYHRALEWKTLENGECEVRARVFGDLDDDGIYSTFEMVGTHPGPAEWNGEMTHYVHPLE